MSAKKKPLNMKLLQQKTLMSLFLNYYLKQFPISQCIQSSLIWIWKKKIGHIKLARDNTHIIVYPATANIISKFAKGFCDDLALTCMIAANKPIYFAPAMNKEMWANQIIQDNVDYLKKIGHHFIGPDDGSLACGEYGSGRLVDPSEIISQLK